MDGRFGFGYLLSDDISFFATFQLAKSFSFDGGTFHFQYTRSIYYMHSDCTHSYCRTRIFVLSLSGLTSLLSQFHFHISIVSFLLSFLDLHFYLKH